MGDAGIFIEKSVHIEAQKMILNQLKLIWYGDRIVMKKEREGVIKWFPEFWITQLEIWRYYLLRKEILEENQSIKQTLVSYDMVGQFPYFSNFHEKKV